jgi:hypothetical protein
LIPVLGLKKYAHGFHLSGLHTHLKKEVPMSIRKFIQKLLKIKGYSVVDFTFNNWCKELWLEVKPHKNGARCPWRWGQFPYASSAPGSSENGTG